MGRGVGEEAEVGVDAADEVLQLPEVLQCYAAGCEYLGADLLRGVEGVVKVSDDGVGEVDAPGLDDVAEGLDALVGFLDIDLVRMDLLVKMLRGPGYEHIPEGQGVFLRAEDAEDIVHKALHLASVRCAEGQHDRVHEGEDEVGQDLRRDVSDGRADEDFSKEQTLLPRHLVLVVVATEDAVLLGMMPKDGPGEPQKRVDIFPVVVLLDEGLEELPEYPPVDGHEEGLHVQLYYPRLPGVPVGYLLDLHVEGLDGGLYTETYPAVEGDIAHLVEALLHQGDDPETYPVLGDAVAEISRKYLPEARPRDVEPDRCGRGIDPQLYLGRQYHQVAPDAETVIDTLF